ncbi:MAG TPA: hypothetical protein VFR08_03830 [Candidatus Angelobacter sp.]|nr:hypothetical protein [Candidatus Angelobacter sp.]
MKVSLPCNFALVTVVTALTFLAASSSAQVSHQINSAGTTRFYVQAATPQKGPTTLTLQRVGSSSFASAPMATDISGIPDEIDAAVNGGDSDGGDNGGPGIGINRSLPGTTTGSGRIVSSKPKSNPTLGTHFQGLNFHDQRFANGGNQFSVEPPDQALCAGNGFVVESVNDVLQVYDAAGNALLNGGQAVDLNTFYGYPAAINRTTNARGPSITDPVCLFDQAIGRFVHVVLTLDHIGTTASLSGKNHLDIAVSDTGNPTGTWTIFKLPVQNDGTDGTPNHHCFFINNAKQIVFDPCLGDYPHIGADANGIYLTTNEFTFFGSGFFGAQVYGIGNNLLTGGTGSVVLFDTLGTGPDGAGFTVWPAQSPGNQFDTDNAGTEFFLSSNAVFSDKGTSQSILVWTMLNTSSLNTTSPAPTLTVSTLAVDTYAVPPRAKQPAGNRPLSECIADTVILPNCNTTVAGVSGHNNATFGPPNGSLNANDSRMQQVAYANGRLWGALDTAVNVGGQDRAGIAFYVINPNSKKIVVQGQAGMANTDLTYPAVGVTQSGRGVIAFTLTGDNDFPTAALAGLDAIAGMGSVQKAAAGAGAWDGFTSYVVFGSGRPRWGDYGAAAVDGNDIWVASEYIAQTCTYAQYLLSPIGQCGGTRGALSNWSTHVSKVTP